MTDETTPPRRGVTGANTRGRRPLSDDAFLRALQAWGFQVVLRDGTLIVKGLRLKTAAELERDRRLHVGGL